MRVIMIFQAAKMAVHALLSNKLRSFLTMLGIIIGVVTLVVLVSLADGASASVADEIAGMGSDLLTVQIADDKGRPLKLKDLEQIEALEDIALAAPLGRSGATGERKDTSEQVTLYGTTAAYREIQGLELLAGRFLKTFDVEGHTSVAVLSQAAAESFFGTVQAAGEELNLNGRRFLVVGVLAQEEKVTGNTTEHLEAYIPYSTLMRMAEDVSAITSFSAKAADEEDPDRAEAALEELLLERFSQDEEAFTIVSQSALMETMGNVDDTFALLLGGIAAVSLLVGGIGIMNIMLVSVTERTREIGIRKSLGARTKSILLQFLAEAGIITLIGGLIGILLGALGARAVCGAMGFAAQINVSTVIIAAAFSSGVGIFFGIYPARKAAKLSPIEALRHE